jgi:hypothetical protein
LAEESISEEDFQLLTALCGWATCGQPGATSTNEHHKPTDSIPSDIDGENHLVNNENIANNAGSENHNDDNDGSYPKTTQVIPIMPNHSTHHSGINDPEGRRLYGWKCKRLLDVARCHYLMKFGYHVQLVAYADTSTTLENIALVAYRPQKATQETTSTLNKQTI